MATGVVAKAAYLAVFVMEFILQRTVTQLPEPACRFVWSVMKGINNDLVEVYAWLTT